MEAGKYVFFLREEIVEVGLQGAMIFEQGRIDLFNRFLFCEDLSAVGLDTIVVVIPVTK